jgi:hypothetical protein
MLVNPLDIPSPSTHNSQIDWNKCCLCQNKDRKSDLSCPGVSKNGGAGYISLANKLDSLVNSDKKIHISLQSFTL